PGERFVTSESVQPRSRKFTDRSIVQLTLVRFREFTRQPEAVFWTFVFPILLAVGLGLAFRARAPERPRVGVVADREGADRVISSLRRDSSVIVEPMDDSTGARALRTAKVALLIIPDSNGSAVRYVYDPLRDESANARLIVDRAIQVGAGRVDPVRVVDRRVTERGSRYIDFVIPGLLGMNLMGSGVWGIGFAIVDSRSKRLLKRFMATPMSRAEYLLAFLFSRMFFLIIEVVTLLGFGALVFGVPLRGSLIDLSAICLLSALAFGGLGLLIASRAKTVEGVSGLMNFVMLPMWIFSGVFFSSSNFPAVVQPLIQALPLTAVNDALRSNMLEGTPIGALWVELAVIAGWLLISFVAALKLFRWR
ncbi:MAG TPA: ABC transporter permease, partial [Gemmatimonadaceae bacterium]|nr:ABC transporter permease [Gemmatimonadaceae bacterium]